MPIYEFTCPDCPDVDYTAFKQGGPPEESLICPTHGIRLRRRFSFTTPRMFQPFNDPATGEFIRSKQHHREVLKRISEEQTLKTGILHDYVPVDMADMRDASGVTEEGLDTVYRQEVKEGRREVKLWL